MANIDTLRKILSNDLVAKWVNLRDYALDTLYSKSDIANLMDEIDKYGYGEWVENNGTWGPKGNVTRMYTNANPYGEVIVSASMNSSYPAYNIFDTNTSTYPALASSTTGKAWIGYRFCYPVNVKRVRAYISRNVSTDVFDLFYSDDGINFNPIVEKITNVQTIGWHELNLDNYGYHLFWIIRRDFVSTSDGFGINELQFYGRELKSIIPAMESASSPIGTVTAVNYLSSPYEPYKAFDGDAYASRWVSAEGTSLRNLWLRYSGSEAKHPYMFAIKSLAGAYSMKNFNIYGSNDDFATYDLLYSGQKPANNTWVSGIINTENSYKQYQLAIIDTWADTARNSISIYDFQLFAADYQEYDWDIDKPRRYFYDHGVEVEEIVDSDVSYSSSSTHLYANGVDKKEYEIFMHVGQYPTYTQDTGIRTKEMIDLSDYDFLCVVTPSGYTYRNGAIYDPGVLIILDDIYTNVGTGEVFKSPSTYNYPRPNILDITNVLTSYYIILACVNGRRTEITEIWIE